MKEGFVLDRTKFDAALRQFRQSSRRAIRDVLVEQARGVMRKIVDWTPPGGKRAQGSAAKARGEAKVEADIRKLMEPGRGKDVSNESPASVHKANRSQGGRGPVRRRLNPRIKIRRADLVRYIREKQRRVGFLAAGWKAAAEKLKVNLPAWIKRHSAPGSAKISMTSMVVEVEARNFVSYKEFQDLERRVQSALDSQAAAMLRRVENYAIRKAAKQAGFR